MFNKIAYDVTIRSELRKLRVELSHQVNESQLLRSMGIYQPEAKCVRFSGLHMISSEIKRNGKRHSGTKRRQHKRLGPRHDTVFSITVPLECRL